MTSRTSRFITSCLLLLVILGSAVTPVDAYDPPTTCQITLWFDTNFQNPTNLTGEGGNPPPGSIIIGTGGAARPRFNGSGGAGNLSRYVMRVDDMNPFDSDWTNYDNAVSSIQFEHVENGVYVPGCDSWTAILYDDPDFEGESISLTGSQTHLSTIGWNDRASSVVVVGPAFDHDTSPPDGCTVELYEHAFSGNTWGTSSHVNPYADINRYTYNSQHGAGKISTIRFGGECGTTRVKLQNGPTDYIEFTNADGPTYNLSEFGWNDRADYWTVNFDVAPDPTPLGCILRVFSDDEYTGQSWAIAGSQTTGSINANQGAGVISSLAFEGECGNSEVILADGNGNSAYVRAADGAQHPLWLSDWNNRAQSLTANFVSGPPVPTDPNLPAPIYVPCEVRLFDGLYSGSRWSANTEQTTTGVFSSSQGGGLVSSVEFVGAWCNDTFLELYDVHPNQDADAVPYVIKVADGTRRDLGTYGFDNKTQFWRVNFSDDPPVPSKVPNVVGLDYTQAEIVLSRMFYRPVADLDEDLVMGQHIQGDMTDRTVHNKVLWTRYPSGNQLDAGTPLPPGSAVHYAKMIHPDGYPPPPPPPGPDVSFEVMSGQASDVGAGNGPIWTIGKHSDSAYRQFMEGWQNKGGGFARIDGGGNSIWAVDQAGNTRYVLGVGGWEDVPAGAIPAQDVGHGWGKTWIAGSNPPYDIQRLKFTLPLTWDTPISVPGGAKRIDVDLHGNPWVVNQSGQIYRHLAGGWGLIPGAATDIGCGQNGDVWIAGTNPVAGGYEIFRWNEDKFGWDLIPGIGGVAVSVDGMGRPYVLADDGTIYEGTLNAPSPSPPPASHPPVPSVIGMTTTDAVWAIQNAGYVASRSSTTFTTDPNLVGTIESTSPAGGEPLGPGSTVTYVDLKYGLPLPPSTFETLGQSTLPTDFAIEADVTINRSQPWNNIITIGFSEYGNQAALRLQAGEEGQWYIAVGDGAAFNDEYFEGHWKFGTPFKLRVTYDHQSTHTSVYENGVRVLTYSPVPVPSGMTGTVVLGTDGAGPSFNAQVSGFQIIEVSQPDFHTDWSDGYPTTAAIDIGVGNEGSVWIVDENQDVYRFEEGRGWQNMELGGASRIDVDHQGNAWVVMADNSFKYWYGTFWMDLPGALIDVGCGADGSVWGVGANPRGMVWRYDTRVEGNWKDAHQVGERVDVATNGRPYVVRDDGSIWHYIGDRDANTPEWVHVDRSLRVKDIGVGGPSIWAVAQDGSVHRWGDAVNDWQLTNGQGHAISVDQHGYAWAIEADSHRVLRGIGQ